jgi:hypothetical protein
VKSRLQTLLFPNSNLYRYTQFDHAKEQARLLHESNARYEARVEQLEALVLASSNQTSTLRSQLAKVAATNAMLEDAHGWDAMRGASDPGGGGGGGGVYPGKEGSTHAGGAFSMGGGRMGGGGGGSGGAGMHAMDVGMCGGAGVSGGGGIGGGGGAGGGLDGAAGCGAGGMMMMDGSPDVSTVNSVEGTGTGVNNGDDGDHLSAGGTRELEQLGGGAVGSGPGAGGRAGAAADDDAAFERRGHFQHNAMT